MAHTTQDNSLLLDTAGKEVKEQAAEAKGGVEAAVEGAKSDAAASTTPPVAEAKTSPTSSSTDVQSNTTPSRPSLVALNSTTSSATSITPVAPHPKRFSSVNINKKFLEKNTASASSSNASGSSAAKAGSATARPPIQSTSSHSRLVAAKLTASPAVSSSPGGWSRPSSVAPSPGTTTGSPISTSPLPTLVAHPAAPQLPHAGKVIQPQPRAQLVQSQPTPKESAPKPVWGTVKPPTGIRSDIEPSDFPTAAEVAHSVNSAMLKQAKADEAKATSESAAKALRSEEADAFRGIHLDPNAHHWDDMEEDDDNFLDGVIEFGDGRQYKVETSESQESRISAEASSKTTDTATNGPVAKEERFVDDFDRSWPKSRSSPASAPRDVSSASVSHSITPANISPVVSQAAHSPQEPSRVLFNERSNRLEPYSQAHRPNNVPFSAKRPGFPDHAQSDFKGSSQNIQVLQKPAGADMSRARRFSNVSNVSNGGGSYAGGPVNGFAGDRHREPHRRDGPPPSPRLTRDLPPHVQDAKDFVQDRGRRGPNMMGPPPLPPHVGQGGRQLPPHLSQGPSGAPSPRLPSRDSRHTHPEPPLSATSPSSALPPAQSPAISHKSLVSPAAAPDKVLPPLAVPDLEVVRKDVMHTAAERAKQRRLQEEAEREAQKERARKKAAELEEKMKAAEAEKEKEREKEREAAAAAARALEEKKKEEEAARQKEKEAIAIIENAVKRPETVTKPLAQRPTEPVRTASKPTPVATSPQAPFAQPFERRPGPQRAGSLLSRPPPASAAPPTPASQTESWRARTAPIPPAPRQIQPRPSTTTNFVAAGPSAAEQVETIANSQADLEVVDFSDLAKFAGVTEAVEPAEPQAAEAPTAPTPFTRPSRPVASDFFEAPITLSDEVPASKKADFGAWRRRVSQEVNEPPKVQIPDSNKVAEPAGTLKEQPQQLEAAFTIESAIVSTKEPLTHIDQTPGQHIVHVSPSQRTPRGPFKEAAMSALTDTMSRIKGALLHAHDPSKEAPEAVNATPEPSSYAQAAQQGTPRAPAANNRWVPPAMRPRQPAEVGRTPVHDNEHDEPREVFLVTMSQPPLSPPADKLSVKLPSTSKPVPPIPKKQLHAFSRPPFPARALDVMTFDPPVYDMRKDWSLNDVLFRKQPPPGFKGKWKYRVWLPRVRGPRLVNGVAAKSFVRPTVADGASTWRKAPAVKIEEVDEVRTLDTVSRSPPPETTPPHVTIASIPKSSNSPALKASDISSSVRTRSQPKMPQGSAVAFVRDSRIDVVEADPKPLVNFIVGSQLEEAKPTTTTETPASKIEDDDVPIFASIKSESKSSDDMTESVLVTPPSHHSSAWARSSVSLPLKDSPARAPDPEHLKAVWSQTSNKAGLHPVNSLEGIADDLTGLPFTIQDVKSEDGETPPPSLPNGPPRILPFEVSRAFQQVPTSSASAGQPSNRPSFSPPSTQAPVARPATAATTTATASAGTPTYQYPPTSPANMRPSYVTYSSPIMGHPPGPIVYGHPMSSSPVQRRMQINPAHTPLYSQPMWMTMPPSQGMRPMPSPYPAQMMPYSPGYVPHMPPNMMPGAPQGQNGGRGRGVPVMSPGMSHAHPQPVQSMYGGSPVVIHAVPVQNHGYMAMPPPPPAGRGQPQNGQMPPPPPPVSHPQQSPHNPPMHPPPPNGFNPGSNPTFARPSW